MSFSVFSFLIISIVLEAKNLRNMLVSIRPIAPLILCIVIFSVLAQFFSDELMILRDMHDISQNKVWPNKLMLR